MKSQSTDIRYSFYLSLLVLCPSPSFFSIEINYLIQFAALIFVTAHCLLTTQKAHLVSVIAFALLCCTFFIAMAINEAAIGIKLSTYLREGLKLAIFPAFLLHLSSACSPSIRSLKKTIIILTAVQLTIILLTTTQTGVNIGSFLYDTRKLSAGTAIEVKIRYLGSFENPNYLALFFVMAYAFIATYNKTRTQFLSFTAFFILVLLTGSRTGLIALLFCASLIHYKVASLLIVPALLLFYRASLTTAIPDRFQEITSIARAVESHSLSVRLDILDKSVHSIRERPFFGYFESPFDITDNWYILMALRYGIIPCATFILLLLILLYKRFGVSYINRQFLITASVPIIFSSTGAFLDNPRIFGITAILLFSTTNSDRFRSEKNNKRERYRHSHNWKKRQPQSEINHSTTDKGVKEA